MKGRLIDTNIVSYVLKNDTRGEIYSKHLENHRLYISFMTVAEIYHWMIRRQWNQGRIQRAKKILGTYRTLIYDDEIAWKWAEVMAITGQSISVGDAWIAVVALRFDLPLVTHNRKDFEHIPNLTLISES